jgi:uncharacterized protein (TIGR02246 family)
MRTLRVALAVAVTAGLMTFSARTPAGASDADVLQQAKDRQEIEALMWRYVRALDTLDPDAYASVFTEDGEFVSGGNPTKGTAALKKMVADLKAGQAARREKGEAVPAMYHVITNATLELVSKDEARYHTYWMTVFEGTGPGTQPRVAAVGRGVDQLVRVNGKWRIKSRNVRPTTS